ncbi:MAG: hypothetical protein GX443_12800 [Deltaproteobacteria bacterium]|nr:hypothetical protein [Deltaproteobacteria bacterium]
MPKERVCRGLSMNSDRTVKNTPNPSMCKEGKGMRNFACQHYDSCLDKAAKAMWSGFTCKECTLHHQKEEESSSQKE